MHGRLAVRPVSVTERRLRFVAPQRLSERRRRDWRSGLVTTCLCQERLRGVSLGFAVQETSVREMRGIAGHDEAVMVLIRVTDEIRFGAARIGGQGRDCEGKG